MAQLNVFALVTLIVVIMVIIFLVLSVVYFYRIWHLQPPSTGESIALFWTGIVFIILYVVLAIYCLWHLFYHTEKVAGAVPSEAAGYSDVSGYSEPVPISSPACDTLTPVFVPSEAWRGAGPVPTNHADHHPIPEYSHYPTPVSFDLGVGQEVVHPTPYTMSQPPPYNYTYPSPAPAITGVEPTPTMRLTPDNSLATAPPQATITGYTPNPVISSNVPALTTTLSNPPTIPVSSPITMTAPTSTLPPPVVVTSQPPKLIPVGAVPLLA